MNDAEVLRALEARGLALPAPPAPVATYVSARRSGSIVFLAGQIPIEDGQPMYPGALGASVSVETGQQAAARAALQALSALRQEFGGSLDAVGRLLQLTVYVASAPGFVEHSKVANGASDLLVDLLGEEGRHARAAVGVASLPLGSCVELAMTAEVA